MFSSTWRYLFDILVVVLSAAAVAVSVTLLRSSARGARWWILRSAAWIGAVMLLLRGVAGMIVDGTSDLIWWPTFLVGGLLLSSVAWLARRPSRSTI